ncbi:MAG: benzylsuccinate synthase gamma subunit family protein [Actinobacteria bacterium]|nr:benzylsuccinate synthase gamma subunit family protein [Actinomycetota bacterium]
MIICSNCQSFFELPKDADDYAEGKGDCVREEKDEKGKFWLSKSTQENSTCSLFKAKH